jgi:hypothetical protein
MLDTPYNCAVPGDSSTLSFTITKLGSRARATSGLEKTSLSSRMHGLHLVLQKWTSTKRLVRAAICWAASSVGCHGIWSWAVACDPHTITAVIAQTNPLAARMTWLPAENPQ